MAFGGDTLSGHIKSLQIDVLTDAAKADGVKASMLSIDAAYSERDILPYCNLQVANSNLKFIDIFSRGSY